MILGSCATTGCKSIKNKYDKKQCEEADKRFYNNTGWRYDRPIRNDYR